MKNQKYPLILSFYTIAILVISFCLAVDKATYCLEISPILLIFPILFFTYDKFKFTQLVYVLLGVHFLIMCIGGIYTYAEVPLGFWLQDWFGFTRNNYDKIGHFAQGFVPAILIREILLRCSPLQRGKWLAFITVAICLALSAIYELFEWWVCLLKGDSAEAFLGTQGYEWDAQSDIFLCLIGATIALLTLSKLHNKILEKNNFLKI